MIFLVHYDRRAQRLERFVGYSDDALLQAQDDRLKLELSLLRSDRENEIVLLSAPSEEAVRNTHGRYFYKFADLAARSGFALAAS
ncbi:hypothetical protein PV762_08785 [Mitsuaria sp. CC2]|jgi:hypothetical protein|uniref:hypothetical protein n=1 Tax=Mitsuaria sp. CC2 TaxID=3029186 RepID=UPI003B8D2ED6